MFVWVGWKGGWRAMGKGHEGTYWGDGKVLNHNRLVALWVYICQTL